VIVVSDTSPLNYLLLIGAIDVLPALFDGVYAPPDVMGNSSTRRPPKRSRDGLPSRPRGST
jgi:hypothetical protein